MDSDTNLASLAQAIKSWSSELGFQQTGICDTQLQEAEQKLEQWLQLSRHGTMTYMQQHGIKRSRPALLVAETKRIISVRMDYWPQQEFHITDLLNSPSRAYISKYALGRDYHKLMRKRLQKLAHKIQQQIGKFGYRVFVDSAPVLEKALAQKAGLGWIGKHTNLINQEDGSWFFLGEIYTDLPLPIDQPAQEHCGTCQSCIDICPTNAIVAPYELDARLCISYLTIELRESIPENLRPLIGNRIYGCDDCQSVCPWNRFAQPTLEPDFLPRNGLDSKTLVELFLWTRTEFLKITEGSAIRRIGYECWLRNIAVALGNAESSALIIEALTGRQNHSSALVREHVEWALTQHSIKK